MPPAHAVSQHRICFPLVFTGRILINPLFGLITEEITGRIRGLFTGCRHALFIFDPRIRSRGWALLGSS